MTVLSAGSFLIACGLNGFLVPAGLMEGGALGISLIVHYTSGFKVGLTFLTISLPIFLMAWLWHRPFFYNGIHGMLASALIIDLLAPLQKTAGAFPADPLSAALCGGILIGIGTGVLLRSGISIGGTDLLAQLLAKQLNVNAGLVILIFDLIIVSMGSLLIPGISLLLSAATVLCVGGTISLITSGTSAFSRSRRPAGADRA
ncbi:hypothetical protein NCCP2716_20040 [Sporosarcina sp. NCCP-2716]|uniref:YitT family protein n=1 Tax=Sporosarcina sp. NCCP-2716 TaxID=2943679 RepID=UPI0020415A9B|nr:YitT family protein [Sporosarcina sp. NCCP-2716]GKV69506.1 hypothetical protein NCCP2716_20040 [Sporosarcina sp. NCCP-2716]